MEEDRSAGLMLYVIAVIAVLGALYYGLHIANQ